MNLYPSGIKDAGADLHSVYSRGPRDLWMDLGFDISVKGNREVALVTQLSSGTVIAGRCWTRGHGRSEFGKWQDLVGASGVLQIKVAVGSSTAVVSSTLQNLTV